MPFFFSVVPEFRRLVHFRFGRCLGQKGPGFVIPLWPIIDQVVVVDLRELFLDVPIQTCITKDNAPVSVDMLVYMRVVDPQDSVLKVEDFLGAARGMSITTLRAVVGDIALDDVLAKRDRINQIMQAKLDEVTVRWGVKVTAVEIREIQPPHDIQEAMSRQMSAERNRRAAVLQADGEKQANITVAEGEKQSAILRAEGDRQATILRAEADRQAAILRAEGFSNALDKIFQVAKGVDAKTMSLQYFDTLRAIGESPSTKYVFPLEFTNFLRPFGRMFGEGEDGGGAPRRNVDVEDRTEQ
jgi:regulator of protease activity HflC (stomatin/prohibitin superfamily)